MLFEGFLTFVLVLIALYIFLYLDANNRRKSVPVGFPPGPTTFPFMESFYFSSSNLLKTVEKLRKKFGDIIGLQLGEKNVVIISNYELIQEAYNTPALCGKHVSQVDSMISKNFELGNDGVLQKDFQDTNNLERKFILKTLRDFGFGPRTIENIIQENVTELISTCKSVIGKTVNPIQWIQLAVFNTLLHFITSETLRQSDRKLKNIWENFETVMSTESSLDITPTYSRFLPPQFLGWKKVEKGVIFVIQFLKLKIQEHKVTLGTNEDGFHRDFMEAYLEEINDTKDLKSPFYGEVGELNLIISCLNLIRGSRKTCTTILWSLYHIAQNPIIQKKLHEEIDRHIGIYRLAGIKDKLAMPYTEALLMECDRLSSVSPFGHPHNSTETVSFHGYTIPEDTLILANLHDVHYDTKLWDDADTFRPERFLTPDGKDVVKAHRPVIWSTIGKRTSPNELLGSDNFFIFITSLFQRFNIMTVEDPKSNLSLEYRNSTCPPTFKVVFEDRLEFLDRKERKEVK